MRLAAAGTRSSSDVAVHPFSTSFRFKGNQICRDGSRDALTATVRDWFHTGETQQQQRATRGCPTRPAPVTASNRPVENLGRNPPFRRLRHERESRKSWSTVGKVSRSYLGKQREGQRRSGPWSKNTRLFSGFPSEAFLLRTSGSAVSGVKQKAPNRDIVRFGISRPGHREARPKGEIRLRGIDAAPLPWPFSLTAALRHRTKSLAPIAGR